MLPSRDALREAALRHARGEHVMADLRLLAEFGVWIFRNYGHPEDEKSAPAMDTAELEQAIANKEPATFETRTYSDGTIASGPGPLPAQSPAQQDAQA